MKLRGLILNNKIEIEKSNDCIIETQEYLKTFKNQRLSYAEYFTPIYIAKLISKCLINDTHRERIDIYDPAAGSGTLAISLASELKKQNCTDINIYMDNTWLCQ